MGSHRGLWTSHSEVEVAVPTLRRAARQSWLPVRLISASVLIVAVWLLYWFGSDDVFYIQNIQVEGSERLPEAELMAISGLEGINIFWSDTQVAERELEELPDIAAARVDCGLPADCVIHLVERQPMFVWLQGDAKAWIGTDGMALPARGDLPDAIVLDVGGSSALKPGDQVAPTLVTAVAELQRLRPDVQRYEYSEQYGLSFRNPQGWLVRLGDGPEMETKLRVLASLTQYLAGQGVVPSLVDVRFPEAPYYQE
jgi:cell division septal protein FtsQ